MTLLLLGRRNMVPNWRSVDDTIKNGEFDGFILPQSRPERFDIHEYVTNWRFNRSLSYAGELISAAIANNHTIEGDVEDACNFILEKSPDKESPLCHLAESLISNKKNASAIQVSAKPMFIPDRATAKAELDKEIRKWRLVISRYPYNPISHIELSRAYLRIGYWEKARREAEIASVLAPHNRYVTRCAVRCFSHIREFDRAKYILSKNQFLKADPWLIATDIAVDLCREKTPRNVKYAIRVKDSKNFSPLSITELSMALATNELLAGGKNKTIRKYVNDGLVRPIDNSLAQAQWISEKNPYIVIDPRETQKVNFNYEAETFQYFYDGLLPESYGRALLWFEDSGFSRRATLAASNLAVYTGRMDDSFKILAIGLLANPGEGSLINNLAYNELLEGRTENAWMALNSRINTKELYPSTVISLTATRGMYFYRIGQVDQGEALYNQAIESARKNRLKNIEQNAEVNLIREKYLAGILSKEEALRRLDSFDCQDPQVRLVLESVRMSLENCNPKKQ